MSSSKGKQIDPIEKAIEVALSPGSCTSYKSVWSFVDEAQDVANEIGKIIPKEPDQAASL